MAQFSALYGDALDTELGTADSTQLFTTARRKAAINEGQRQFVGLTECVVRRSSVTVSSSAREFNLNSTAILPGSSNGKFLRVSKAGPVYLTYDTAGTQQTVIAGDEDFPQRDEAWLDAAEPGWRSTNTGTPSAWYLRPDGGSMFFGLNCPADVSTSETAELLIPYVVRPSSMTADTHVPFRFSTLSRTDLDEFEQALVHYAAHKLEKLRKDTDASQQQLQAFLGYVQRYVATFRPKGMRTLRTARNYFQDARRGGRDAQYGALAPWWYR